MRVRSYSPGENGNPNKPGYKLKLPLNRRRIGECIGIALGVIMLGTVSCNSSQMPAHPTTAGVKNAPAPTATVDIATLPAPTNHVTVSLNGPTKPSQLALSTNVEGYQDIADAATPRGTIVLNTLQSWNPPMVRLHFGFLAPPAQGPALPEITSGDWNFSGLDATITQLQSRHVSFFLNVRTAPPWMFDSVGQLEDSEFPVYAHYLADLVGWYNKGGFTDDSGVYHASGHHNWIHVWEIWNEPKSGQEIPANVPDRRAAPWMTPDRFAALYDLCSASMRAVDPSIVIGGPALGSWPYDDYMQQFIADEHAPLGFVSFHFYAATAATEPDVDALGAVTGDRFLNRLITLNQTLAQLRPGQNIPIWIDELGFDETSLPPLDLRGTTPISYAFISDTFAVAEAQNVSMLSVYQLVSNEQFGIISAQNNQWFRTYWFYRLLAQNFPPGYTLLPVSIDNAQQIVAVAALSPHGNSLHILVANIQVAQTTDANGAGVPKIVRLDFSGSLPGMRATGDAQAFDATTVATSSPPVQPIPLFSTNGTLALQLPLGGYGATLITIPIALSAAPGT